MDGDDRDDRDGAAWQLRLTLLAPSGADDQRQSVQQIGEAVAALGLLPAQKDGIERSVAAALQKSKQGEAREGRSSAAFIRLWTSRTPSPTGAGSGPQAAGAGSQPKRGWGFFLLERQNGPHRVIELYLYQEAGRAT